MLLIWEGTWKDRASAPGECMHICAHDVLSINSLGSTSYAAMAQARSEASAAPAGPGVGSSGRPSAVVMAQSRACKTI